MLCRAAKCLFPARVIDVIDAFSLGHTPVCDPSLRSYVRQRCSATRLALFFASTSRPSRAHSAMSLAHALGCRFKPNHFESVVHQLSLSHHWASIPALVALARAQCGKATARLLNWKLRALIECHRFGRLSHVFNEFARDNVHPTRRTFHLLISGHLRNQDLHSARSSLHLMQSAGFPVDHSTHALIATTYRSLGLDPQVHARALASLSHLDPRTQTRVLNSIIQHFLDLGDELGAAVHINRLIAPSPLSPGTTTGADGVLTPLSHPSPGGMPEILPDAATFTILINYLISKRHFHRIDNLLSRMLQIGIKPDAGVVAALIRSYCLTRRDDMAVSLLAAMLPTDAHARGVLALLRVKRIQRLPISVDGIDLSVHVFNSILPRVTEIRGLGGARSIIRLMRSLGIQSNVATTQVILDYLDRMKHIDTRRLTNVLRSMSRNVHPPTIRHLNIILRNALRREKQRVYGIGWNATAAKFSSTRRYRFTSPRNRYILSSENFDPSSTPHRSHDRSCIQSITLALSRNGIKSDRATFAMWLKHECIADPTLGAAESVFRHMVDRGMHPNRHHFASLLDGFVRAGDMQAADKVVRSAKAAGFEPDVVMWTMLISGYGRKGEPALAIKTFRSMIAAGVSPDVPAIDALAHAYFAVGAYSVARKILLQLWPRVKPFPSHLQNAPLKQLARAFRQSEDPDTAFNGSLTPQEQRSFNRKLRRALQEWKQM